MLFHYLQDILIIAYYDLLSKDIPYHMICNSHSQIINYDLYFSQIYITWKVRAPLLKCSGFDQTHPFQHLLLVNIQIFLQLLIRLLFFFELTPSFCQFWFPPHIFPKLSQNRTLLNLFTIWFKHIFFFCFLFSILPTSRKRKHITFILRYGLHIITIWQRGQYAWINFPTYIMKLIQ